jgi:hypothetical protein
VFVFRKNENIFILEIKFFYINELNRTLGRLRLRWEDNIKIDLQEVGCEVMDWIELAQDKDRWRALMNAVMNFWGPKNRKR